MAGGDRFSRSEAFFGKEGQEKLRGLHVTVIGVGGLGTHVVQQLAISGVGKISVVDPQEADETNRNRYIGLWHDDQTPGLPKVDLAERLIKKIDPRIATHAVRDSFISTEGFAAIMESDWTLGCLDMEGARLILNEVCSVGRTNYVDLARFHHH